MTAVKLETDAEQRARKAQDLPAFADVNLLGIKGKVAEIVGLIGREKLFDEYTLHDVSHLNEMLSMLSWLIPPDTRDRMSPADWMLVVLAIYFHDAGMLITRDEFDRRGESGFIAFRDQQLYSGDNGTDYRSKVARLGDDADRFLYQEFVRHHHGDRIAHWIMGKAHSALGIAENAAREVDDTLSPLPMAFRRDLALVC